MDRTVLVKPPNPLRHPFRLKKNKKRFSLLSVLALLLIALALWLWWGNTSIGQTYLTVQSGRLPGAFQGYTIVQVSDLHNTEFGKEQSRLLEAIREAEPDMIAITGDLVDSRRTDIETAMQFIFGAVKISPVYYVTGNHESRLDDFAQLEKKLVQAGVTVLRNASTQLESSGETIRLIGLDDPDFTLRGDLSEDSADIADAKLKELRSGNDAFTILLSHRPELFDTYAANEINLALCGHAHGGQIRIPFIGALAAPDQGFFPKYTQGMYESGTSKMIVSRGLGNSILPLRVNDRPELVVITLSCQTG